ncbi:3'(2'),5'-bisphosphate nucleotidase CysQ [Shewanella sp. 1_MG-2023]|uniref:3'(2'),5'-bisphosphate nucleotidase CysQ n=1 Tax=unclassified Shewanella TaxID=196818 RepID=UPI0026E3BA5D|nr:MULTISPECIES: 3'(2'),5'-bisphosphate nucleotidase CysQ [unclassified Shewanella]MDO6611647.1 3'(2'),5'-bisphosphate nucleotidase CysQ [Shewanella sp. 7_MG-2023]MDO6771502.1 3'(2'),5'-bisphosphate nucleotidase CysQ [Shewanella sp. 2_MG-2023]MDO6793849.1 3'(2'),5'-bisphosphate nucleotidase CysQ [Shewanella sp. 1_MG-2023]
MSNKKLVQHTSLTKAQLDTVITIAKQAGDAIMQVYSKPDLQIEQKQDDSPVTAADIASHNVIVAELEKHFVDIPVMSEEAADIDWNVRRNWPTYWLIDPLDGTKEFIKRNGEFTVNIALIHNGKAVAGVVYAPVLNKCYSGLLGEGAWLESNAKQQVLDISQQQINDKPIVVGSRSHISPGLAEYVANIGDHQMQSVGSSLKFCLVAEGNADVYPRLGLTSEWDTGAAQAVLESAGGQVLIYPELTPLEYNQKENILNPYFIAASPKWFERT